MSELLKRKLASMENNSTMEANQKMNDVKLSKNKKFRINTEDYNSEPDIVDYDAFVKSMQEAYKFDDKGLDEGNYFEFAEEFENNKHEIKRYFGPKNAFNMLRDRSEVALHYLCEFEYDIGYKEKMDKDVSNLTVFIQKLISK